jgi:uncharacterized protein (TIGR01777 family)
MQPRQVAWDAIEEEVAQAHVVIHLAGEPLAAGRWTPERFERIRASRVDTADRLARAIASSPPGHAPVFVSASAVGFYGMRRDDLACDEETPPGDDVVARLCVAWEAAADPARKAGARVVHPRLGIALGRGGVLARMVGAFRWFVGGPVGTGTQWVSWVHVRDVVRALLFLLDHDDLTGPVNIVAPEPVTMNELARALGRSLGRPSVLRVPSFAVKLAFGEGLAETILTGQRVVPRRLERAGFAFDFPRLEAALADLR